MPQRVHRSPAATNRRFHPGTGFDLRQASDFRRSTICPVAGLRIVSSDARATSTEASSDEAGSAPNARVRIGVAVRSGLRQFTRTPSLAHSSASACVKLTLAALADEYRL